MNLSEIFVNEHPIIYKLLSFMRVCLDLKMCILCLVKTLEEYCFYYILFNNKEMLLNILIATKHVIQKQ